jgi:heavy metal translocating P-type ATPase
MVRIIGQTLSEKTPVEAKTDRALHWFIPGILFLALLSGFLCWFYGLSVETAVTRAITVLVIACPCSLGIAIPLAHVAGVSVSQSRGILIRNFAAFEQIPKLSAFVFDKTGTITTGRWMLHKVLPLGSYTKDKVLSIAASLEKNSDHPIAHAIRQKAQQLSIQTAFAENTTHHENGISALIDHAEVKLGSRDFLENEISINPALVNIINRKDQSLYSTVYMSYDRQPCAIFLLGDRIRFDAAETVGKLKTLGHSVSLISGDGADITRKIGNRINISDTYGGMLPHEKTRFIKIMQEKGYCVAMVGDGINDAPALSQADLAIAVHNGSRLSRETADITLMKEGLKSIIDFLNVAKKVNRKIRQNLVWAFLYNSISIPLAISGFLTPLIAVTAMLLSSMSVIGNTLLLTRNAKG